MTSVPPTNNDDPDDTPQRADSPSTGSSAAGDSPADSGTSVGPEKTDQTWDADDSPSTSTSDLSDSATSSAAEPIAEPGATSQDDAADSDRDTSSAPEATSAAEPAATPATAPGRSSHAAPRPVPSSGEDSSETSRLPTEEEDEALRAERERRFGRVAGPAATQEPPAGPTAQAAEPAAEQATEAPPASGEPQTTTMAPPPPPQEEPDPFADFDDGPTSRAAAHWWGILIAVVFGPVTWYLIADGGERVSYALSQNLEAINVLGLVELAGGLLTLIILLLAARWSSVGSIIIGSIGALIGAAFVAVPGLVDDFLSSQSVIFDRLGQFGTNVFDHLVADGHSGRLLAYGIAFIFIGVISHGARRQGRREERRKAALGE